MRNTEGRYTISKLNKCSIKCKRSTKGTLSSRGAFGYTRDQKTPVLSSDYRTSDFQTNTTEVALRPFTFPPLFSFFPSPLFLTSYLQKTGEWLLSCLLLIRPQAGQITQLQSCAFLHGVDWLFGGLKKWRS
ncbi:hypothetical protein AVEN_27464-1 [Araneus ventricosus]|uniref:Uncharacterized protein n=1 Tax=Araneus ventricosus TaxID=182803 RepID=A0A4Y2K4S8_ARAVE|nr:hypothetical protein AVEN_27464-1 [Araneus ventricosus]